MLKQLALSATALCIAIIPLAASAGEVDNRIHHEQARINQGVRSGQLTRNEYNHVDARLDRINAARRHDLAVNGGHLTSAEYRNLNRRENALSDGIYFDKHNRQTQPGTPPR